MEKIKVVAADDHPVVLMGVREILDRDSRFELVGEARSSSELVELYDRLKPDVVITDYNMPGDSRYGDGMKLVEYLLRHYPETKVLILTMLKNAPLISSLYGLGVSGVLHKTRDLNEILVALGTILRKRVYRGTVSPVPPMAVTSSLNDNDMGVAKLSAREYEVLRHFVVGGLSVNDIARVLNRSVKTVSAQKMSTMRKLEVTNDQALLTFCLERNIFQ
ncbi:response regulator transcription factor [Pseudomonas sp. TTU2014-080ASC]|uniref:response regulator transcription factor n=1 Tax=Pseudomonas sp. TTU2014-080ASC TaxID=1729724 RepID=UPI0007188679|nr:response regulator transcription factor [Pseudomonas sp. TTU2014-080ASC]KRW58108.1 LuxR family transcriptional regulator [Pseudomonas sp. TTU2014-080ASC]